MAKNIYNHLLSKKQKQQKSFALLVDPDKHNIAEIIAIAEKASTAKVDYIFVGGSLLMNDSFETAIKTLKQHTNIPVIIFPGNNLQISHHADAILFLSLISGRNPELLIGRHVITAPLLKQSPLEVISTGYLLIESGLQTTVSYISNTQPIPANKPDVAACTAMAGELLGMKLIFMDAGSGALNPISETMIKAVAQNIDVPIIVGGGIKTPEKVINNCRAGADVIVVGNAIEKEINLLTELSAAVHSENKYQQTF